LNNENIKAAAITRFILPKISLYRLLYTCFLIQSIQFAIASRERERDDVRGVKV